MWVGQITLTLLSYPLDFNRTEKSERCEKRWGSSWRHWAAQGWAENKKSEMDKLRPPKTHPNLQAQCYRRAESPPALPPGALVPQQRPPSAALQNVTRLLFSVLQSLLSLHISHTNRLPRTILQMGKGSWWPLETYVPGFESRFAKYWLLRLGLFTDSKP